MIRTLAGIALAVALSRPATLGAQGNTHLPVQLAAEATLYELMLGTGPVLVGPTFNARFRPWPKRRWGLQSSLFHAPERGAASPGLTAFTTGATLSAGSSRSGPDLVFSAGFGVLHFGADARNRAAAACRWEDGCMWESPTYDTGWEPVMHFGARAQLPVSSRVSVSLNGQLVAGLTGLRWEENAGPHLSLGFGLGWQP